MTQGLERPESWNDRKARTTGKPELSEKPERPSWSLWQYIIEETLNSEDRIHSVNNWIQILQIKKGSGRITYKRRTLKCAIRECALWVRSSSSLHVPMFNNERRGGSGRWWMLSIGLGPWRSSSWSLSQNADRIRCANKSKFIFGVSLVQASSPFNTKSFGAPLVNAHNEVRYACSVRVPMAKKSPNFLSALKTECSKGKRMLIATDTVWDHYSTIAILLNLLFFHWSLLLRAGQSTLRGAERTCLATYSTYQCK